jgi:hypothetical protein
MGNNLRFSEPTAHLVVNRWMCFYYALSVQISSVGATNYLDVCSVAATPRDNKRFHDDLNKIFAFTKEFVSPVEEGTRDVPPIFIIPLPNPITD